MPEELKRVRLESDTDLRELLDDVYSDRAPRLIERDGEPLAVIVSPADYAGLSTPPKSRQMKQKLLSLAGVWKDLDADQMIEDLYRARHEAPPSAPVPE